jgi:hypothetical protein
LRSPEETGKADVEGHASPPVAEEIPSAMLQRSPFFYQMGFLSVKAYQERANFAYSTRVNNVVTLLVNSETRGKAV